MANTLPTQTYRSPILASLNYAFWAVVAFAGAWLLMPGSPGGGIAHNNLYNWLFSIACLCGGAYCLYAAVPYAIQFDPKEQRYEYRWGLGPLSISKSGFYAGLDSIYVQQNTTVTDKKDIFGNYQQQWRTTYTVNVMWSAENRKVILDYRRDMGEAQVRAEEIAAATGVPYGGVYDYWNKMWLQGPFHKVITSQVHETESQVADEVASTVASHMSAPTLSQPPLAHPTPPHAPAGLAEAPPALGDEAGLNESGMWK